MTRRRIGYARAASGTDLASEVQRLKAAGCKSFYSDLGSSNTSPLRPGLRDALAAIRSGDEFTVRSVDRFARRVDVVTAIIAEIAVKGATLRILDQVDSPASKTPSRMQQLLFKVGESFVDASQLGIVVRG